MGETALKRFNTNFLPGNDKLNEFKVQLNKRFHALHNLLTEEESTLEDNWKGIKETLTSTCQEVLDLKKHHHKELISVETLDKIQEKKNKKTAINNSQTREKVKARAEYTEANKQVRKSIKADNQKYVEDLATTDEKAARKGGDMKLYDTTNKLTG
ncbi:unnamed protein product [Schistosoma curassoni]|uniref:Uncharacterized protein n=1 Tax=Schistosoma curassoni TaxID=6186 RepID=A0A183K692_9TREM|nr:unnamed protein product [Schistosoma curassoni]